MENSSSYCRQSLRWWSWDRREEWKYSRGQRKWWRARTGAQHSPPTVGLWATPVFLIMFMKNMHDWLFFCTVWRQQRVSQFSCEYIRSELLHLTYTEEKQFLLPFAKWLQSSRISPVEWSLIETEPFHDGYQCCKLQLVGLHLGLPLPHAPGVMQQKRNQTQSRKGVCVYFPLSSLQHNASHFPGGIMLRCSRGCWLWISFHCRYSGRHSPSPGSSLSTDPITLQTLTNK